MPTNIFKALPQIPHLAIATAHSRANKDGATGKLTKK